MRTIKKVRKNEHSFSDKDTEGLRHNNIPIALNALKKLAAENIQHQILEYYEAYKNQTSI